jgi:hypothetical protein
MIRPIVWSSALATYELAFDILWREIYLPEYHHFRLLVRGRGNWVVRRYVLLHVIRCEVSFPSPLRDIEEVWTGGRCGETEMELEQEKRR